MSISINQKIVKLVRDYLSTHNSSSCSDVKAHVDVWLGFHVNESKFRNVLRRFFIVSNNVIEGKMFYRRGIISTYGKTVACQRHGGRYSIQYCEDTCKECVPITLEDKVIINYDDKNKMIIKSPRNTIDGSDGFRMDY